MIRYRFPNLKLAGPEAVRCEHLQLARLRRHGPWRASVDSGVELELIVPGWTAAGWSDWADGLEGCSYQVATNLELRPLRRRDVSPDAVEVRMGGGHYGLVEPAVEEGLDIDLDGTVLTEGSGPYMRALRTACDAGKDLSYQQLLAVAIHAVESCHRCPPELGKAMRLFNTTSCRDLLRAAYGTLGKADTASAS